VEGAAAAELPILGEFPELDGATTWLNSDPLTPAALRGKVVVVQFCTFSCVNWLRTLPYVRAWEAKYRDSGLVVIGAHSPEFPFEHDIGKIQAALDGMGVVYPIAVDNDFGVWHAFANNAWPALYFIDPKGRIRHSHLGEEDYERSEQVIQHLLAEAGVEWIDRDLVSLEPDGVELAADWETLGSPETYVGYERATGLASPAGADPDRSRLYKEPARLELNQWALSGDWTVGKQITTLNEPGGRITFRFHARDLNLVLGPPQDGASVRFLELIDGKPPNGARGIDVDQRGNGAIAEARLHQLIRQTAPIRDHSFEITFIDAGAQAYVFTFG
jgi:thiol-disulfide isomerase/thioredoxin